MDCRELEEKLPLLLRDPVPGELRRAAGDHAASCARCRRLLTAAQGKTIILDQGESRDLTQVILGKTSGPVCRRIEERLVEWVDHGAGGRGAANPEEELLRQHLDDCGECRELVSALDLLREELPRLAEVEPDSRLLPRILDHTSRRPRAKQPWGELVEEWCLRAIRRPRIALEAAYIGALILFLIAGSTAPLIREVSARSVGIVRIEVAAGFAGLEQWSPGETGDGPPSLARRAGQCIETLALAGRYGGRMGGDLLHGDLVSVYGEAGELSQKVRLCWTGQRSDRSGQIDTEPVEGGVRTKGREQPVKQP